MITFISEKGKKDAERHHEKIDDAIRKNVRDVIAEETIITKRKGRKQQRVQNKGQDNKTKKLLSDG